MRRKGKFLTALKTAAVLLITLCCSVFIIKGYSSWLASSETLSIRTVKYLGNDLLSEAELKELTGVQSMNHMAEVSLSKIDSSLRSNPFIETVKVTRKFPGDIVMEIKEKQPVALLRVENELYCIDRFGFVLQSRPGRIYSLPILSGDFKGGVKIGKKAESAYLAEGLAFLNLILQDRPDLYAEISEIVTGCKETLLVYTNKGGIPVKFGEESYPYKIQCLDAILDRMEKEDSFARVKYIDLRYKRQVILGMRI